MSKLEGNERWKSKMVMHEHQEQYDNNSKELDASSRTKLINSNDAKLTNISDAKPEGRATPQELKMIRDYILLPHMLTMVQRSVHEIERNGGILKRLYLAAAQSLMDRISNDMYDLKRSLARANIRIHNDEQADNVIYYAYSCRGHQDRMGIVRDVMRSEISLRLTRYIEETKTILQHGRGAS